MLKRISWGAAALAVALLGWSAQAQTSDYGTIVVKVPAEAQVTIGGMKTMQRGPVRTYYTPPLAAGYKYQYEFTVQWMAAGKEQTATKWVDVAPGVTTKVDFTSGGATKPEDKKPVDKKPEDKKPEDKKPEDKKPEDKKPIDKKPEEKKKDEIKSGAAKVRTFDFTYAAVVKELKPGQEARIWLPYPQNTPFQDVKQVDAEIPGETPPRITQEKEYGNKFLYFTAKANAKGEIPFQVEYRVKRREVLTGGKGTLIPAGESPTLLERYLQPDKLVPTSGKPLDLLKGKKIPKDVFGAAKEFYDTVNGVMKYDKPAGKPWGRGDSVWACDSKYGNCTDFHSVFISMARGNKIPAKFEMGFPIPDKRGEGTVGGYHCWAWFLAGGKNWIPVDISEANRNPALKEYYFGNLTEDRVQFSTGRDITLVPPQKGPALNFLINPYVEVDGAPYPQEKIARKFSYNDVK